jgi:hypothetical protein
MTASQWLGIGMLALLAAFAAFAFRQGEKVKRSESYDPGISDGGDHSGTSSP